MNRSSTLELLAKLRSLNVKLTADGGRLRYTAPAGVMTAELRGELAARKTDLLDFLKEASLATRPQPPAVTPISRDGELPLSFAQARLWLLDRLEPGTATYNIPSCFRFKGKFNLAAFEQSLTEIVRRHEALRTCFLTVDGRPVQKIASPAPFQVSVVDLQGLPEAAREEEAARLALLDARQPFDLGKAPLMRATLLKLAAEEQVLLLNMHHIAFDGWSFGVFERELSVLYEAFLQGQASPLPELPIQYADFAVWQREWLQGEVLQTQLDYWKEKLRGNLPFLELPTDHPRPAVQTYNGSTVSLRLSPELTEGLKTLSRGEGVTLFVTLLAAFQVLLLRYTGQEDLLVGTPIANRNRAEIEDLIGFFVNTLVMRSDLSGNLSFRELLGRVQETALGAYAHQDLPFEKVVQELNPERNISRSPIFQVMFSFLNTPSETLPLAGVSARPWEIDTGTAKFDLTVSLEESGGRITGWVEYCTDLFEAETIRRMVGHYETLLASAIQDPDQRISALRMLTQPERQQLLLEWNNTRREYPQRCVHELFEEQAARTPNAVAVTFEDQSLTYNDLNRRANRLAYQLRRLGVERETRVGICAERSPELVVGLLGILKAGGAYVPLDAAYPRERLAFMLEDVEAPVLLTQRSLKDQLPATKARVFLLEEFLGSTGSEDVSNPSSGLTPQNLAYIMYTSGSTGRPKGVEVVHRGIVRLLFGTDFARLGESEVILQLAPISFDASTFEIWGALLHGGRCVLFPQSVPTARELDSELKKQGVNTLWLTASLFNAVMDEAPQTLSGVQQLLVGGEALSAPHVHRALGLLPATQLVNGYGPTESTTFTCCYKVPPTLDTHGSSIPIGRPIANTQVYILDCHLQPVPIGVAGELHVGGDGLARGYLNQSELTAEKFIRDPFSSEPGARLYKTGDLARYRPDGNIEFLGRLDQQVKIRGFRIELGEIESVLRTHSGVREAVVVVREEGEKRLVAYVVAAGESAATSAELRDYLKQKLPDYMVPAAWVALPALPLTPNGKVDRKALPAPDTARPAHLLAFVAPRTEAEKRLAGWWAEILGLERISIHDDFFELGGHSLLATQLVSRLRVGLGVEVPLRRLFEAPTVAGFAEYLEAILKEASLATRPQSATVKRTPRDKELPLSFAQMRLWLLDRLEPGTATYNIPSCFRFKGKFNLAAFEQSLTEIVRRHEALRTCFLTVDGRPVQKIASPAPLQVSVVDLQGLPEAARGEEAARLALLDARQPFDLGKAPLMRATLLKLAAEEQVLLLNMHHIAFDGWSFGVFERELSVLYKAFLQGQASPLPELPIQYADFAVWQREWLQGEVLQTQLDYWKEKLRGNLPFLELPTDRPRPAVQTYNGSTASLRLSPELTEGLKTLSRGEGVTLFVTLLAAFQVLLLRYTGQEDLLVGTPIANRNRAEIEGLIGFFVNTLVMRSDLSGNLSFRELLGRVQETALGAYAHQDLPFEKLVEELNPERDISRSPIFQVMFSFLNTPMQPLELPGLEPSRMEADSGTSKFDLSLYAIEIPEGLSCTFEYNTDLFNADRIERMLGHLQVLLEGIVAHPEQRLSELPLLPEPEKHRLLVELNQTRADFPRVQCIHDLLQEQVERTPETVALAGPSLTQASTSQVSWTYAELNQRANELAYYLQALGVGPEVLVAVCMERTVEMVVGLLAVLKAGGAYVPLDPAYPPGRLAFILEETQVPVVLTQQSIAAFLPNCQARVVCLDDPNLQVEIQRLAGDDFRFSSNPRDPSHLAYVLYTSGSTGKPKGVEICHRAVVNFLNSMRVVPGMEAQDTLLSVTTLSFDIFGLEIWLPLTTGAKVVIVPEEVARDGRELGALMRRSGATVMQATPSTWRLLLESGWEGNPHLKILCGGEAWPPQLAERLLPNCASLWNMYGPTETTIWSAVYAVGKGKPILIGRPIANTQFYVVDSHLQPVPVGVPGELLIGGEGLARGYLNRPELTAEKFIADPFSTDAESRLYRTGDLVRYLADDTLEFLGRFDQQVKIRGFRIELEEIENVLRAHSGVSDAVVIVQEDGGNQRLVAYFVPSAESDGRPAELRDYLKAKLPDYMVPTTYVMLEKLPLTPNGKVDRKALPLPGHTTIETQSDSGMPRDMLEQLLTQLWKRILGVRHIGLSDDFFDLGGHSFAAVRLFSEIERLTGKNLPLATLFRASTVGQLADVLRKDGWSPPWSSLVPINPGGSQLPLFLVHGAEGNVLLYRQLARYLGPDQPVYGFQSQGLNGNGSFHASIEEMASHYVRELVALQPSGPYRLGGYCLGGAIAFEMAQQLQAQGERVGLVAMLDTYNNNMLPQSKLRALPLLHLLQNVWFHGANFCLVGNKNRWNFVHEKWDVALTRVGIRLRALYHALCAWSSPGLQNSYPHLLVKRVNDHAAMQYVPRPYSGRVAVIRPKGSFWGLDHPSLGWGEVVRDGLEIREIPVYPKGMLIEPFVQMLAAELKVCLENAE